MSEILEQTKNAVDLTALRAKYRHDREANKKIDYKPRRYDYEEGYSFFHHKPLEGMKDEAFSNRNYFMLLNDVAASDMAEGNVIDPLDLTVWVFIKAPNGKYIGTTKCVDYRGNDVCGIYADTDESNLSDRNVFRITRWHGARFNGQSSDENKRLNARYLIAQKGLYMTVDPTDNMFDIVMRERDDDDFKGHQIFIIERGNRPDVVTFCTDIEPSWKYWIYDYGKDGLDVLDGKEPCRIHRYLSLYDQYDPRGTYCKPNSNPCERNPCYNGGYPDNYTGCKPCMVKAIGNTYWSRYAGYRSDKHFLGKWDIGRISNNYVFRINPDIFDIGEDSILVGYDGKVRWVKYHENIFDQRPNVGVKPKYVFEDVKPSFLIEHAYENAVGESEKSDVKLNINQKDVLVSREESADYKNSPIELKTVMTPEHEYSTVGKEIDKAQEVLQDE